MLDCKRKTSFPHQTLPSGRNSGSLLQHPNKHCLVLSEPTPSGQLTKKLKGGLGGLDAKDRYIYNQCTMHIYPFTR